MKGEVAIKLENQRRNAGIKPEPRISSRKRKRQKINQDSTKTEESTIDLISPEHLNVQNDIIFDID
jgi:hypothetical protein